jgi:hypothetical protein
MLQVQFVSLLSPSKNDRLLLNFDQIMILKVTLFLDRHKRDVWNSSIVSPPPSEMQSENARYGLWACLGHSACGYGIDEK